LCKAPRAATPRPTRGWRTPSILVIVIQKFTPHSVAVARLVWSGRSAQRGDFPCFEKQSSLLPSPPRLAEQSLLPRLMPPRGGVAVEVDMVVAEVVVMVVAGVAVMVVVSAVVTVAASPVDMVVLVVAASAAVGLGVVDSEVVQSALSAAGAVVSAQPR